MNMKKYTASAKGFTLVELIVVIVILAILATIAFLSFGSQAASARDAKRNTDLSSMASKINIALAKGTTYLQIVSDSGSAISGPSLAGTSATVGSDYNAGKINFNILEVSAADFKDPNDKDYLIGATSKAGGSFQLAASLEVDNQGNPTPQALVVGNYHQRLKSSTGTISIVSTGATSAIVTLSNSLVGAFRKDDWIVLSGSTDTISGSISKVSSDLATLTLNSISDGSKVQSGATVYIKEDEVNGLIKSKSASSSGVVNGSGTAIPY